MKVTNCIFDRRVEVCFEVQGNTGGHMYHGQRQICCKYPTDCGRCGWNPEVEQKRKAQGIRPRHGYIGSEGLREDAKYVYKGIRLKRG